MNLVTVELMSFSWHFSFEKISFKLSHPSANKSWEDERQWARFNIVIVCYGHLNMTLIVKKKALICSFPVDACFQLGINLKELLSDEKRFVAVCNFNREADY